MPHLLPVSIKTFSLKWLAKWKETVFATIYKSSNTVDFEKWVNMMIDAITGKIGQEIASVDSLLVEEKEEEDIVEERQPPAKRTM